MLRVAGRMVTVATACVAGTYAHAGDTLVSPDPSTLFLLQSKSANATPPYEAMARTTYDVRSANEFERPKAVERAVAALKEKFASLRDVKRITVRLNSHFSEYDATNGEYDFDLNDGSYIPFQAFGRQGQIDLTNGTAAQGWKLPPPDAEEALHKNRGDRSAVLVLTLELLSSPVTPEGQPPTLNTRIARYDVLTAAGNVRLGSMVVADAAR